MDESGYDKLNPPERFDQNASLTHFEVLLTGSTQKDPETGKLCLIEDVVRENFPQWIFNSKAQGKHSLDEINEVRKKGPYRNIIYPAYIAGVDFELPQDHALGMVLQDLNPREMQKIEFLIAKVSGEWPNLHYEEVADPSMIQGAKTEEIFGDNFHLEEVPDHPNRRYLVPVRVPVPEKAA